MDGGVSIKVPGSSIGNRAFMETEKGGERETNRFWITNLSQHMDEVPTWVCSLINTSFRRFIWFRE